MRHRRHLDAQARKTRQSTLRTCTTAATKNPLIPRFSIERTAYNLFLLLLGRRAPHQPHASRAEERAGRLQLPPLQRVQC